MNVKSNTIFIAQFSLLLAIEAIVCFTPLGSLPIGPVVATLSHLPVIMAAILLGTRMGALMGFFFGLFSFMVWTFVMPASPVAFLFTPFHGVGGQAGNWWSLVVCFVPRVLIGVVAGESYRLMSKFAWLKAGASCVGGILGALTNTALVLGGIFVFFGTNWFQVIAAGVITINGLLELVLGGIAGMACVPIMKALKKAD